MDLISAIVDVCVALIGFGGGIGVAIITQKHNDARHSEDVVAKQETEYKTQIDEIKKQQRANFDEIRKETMNEFTELKNCFSDMKASYQNSMAVIELKIDSLEKKQDKHNSVIERTYKLEERMSVTEEMVKVANHRLADIEEKEKTSK